MSRTAEFTLGLLGGIFGFFGAVLALALGTLGSAFGASSASTIIGLGWGAIIFSIIGIIGSVIVRGRAKQGGLLMIISALGGLICISFYYLLPFVLLIIGGLRGVTKKRNRRTNKNESIFSSTRGYIRVSLLSNIWCLGM